MLNARAKITLNAPADKVWAIVTDYAGYARFPGITAANVRTVGRDHPAGMRLTARGDQTDLEWESRGRVAIPLVGALLDYPIAFVLQRSFERILHWIKAELERTPA